MLDRLKQICDDVRLLEAKKASQKLKAGMVEHAARWLAVVNLGYAGKSPQDLKELAAVVRRVEMDHESEAPGAVQSEAKSWLKDLKKNDSFAIKQILKDLPWMFE